jgi:acetylornithine/N-succinyldiaminopimelate aminotransferase
MSQLEDIFSLEKKYFHQTYNRIPLDISHGEGVHLFTKSGERYLDFFSGLAVNALGYAHPGINEAILKQLSHFSHLSNSYITDVQVSFAEMLLKYSGMNKIFFTNSGTEAIEGVLKLLRKKFGKEKKILALSNSFHGRTYGALSLTGREKYRDPFHPLLGGVEFICFNDIEALSNSIDNSTAAIFFEIIQGEGGVNVIAPGFINKLLSLKSKFDFAIAVDEIQSGIGRTGKGFAFEHYNFIPDILVVAKAIGGGLPLGAFLTNEKYSDIFNPGEHGTTFGGNPVACAAGKVVLTEVFENGLVENVRINGEYFIKELELLRKKFEAKIKEVRGLGYFIGIELNTDCQDYVKKFRERKALINCTNKNVLRILPPLIAQKENIDFFLYNFYEILKND